MVSGLQHATRVSTLRLNGGLAEVFELFEPVGEKKWAESWDPSFVKPHSGETEVGMVFTSLHGGEPSVWVVSIYDPARHHIEYIRFSGNAQVTRIIIRCSSNSEGATTAEVTYDLTAVEQSANAAITEMSQEKYERWMSNWETAINFYLRERCALRHHPNP